MMWYTHLMFGILFGLLSIFYFDIPHFWIFLFLVILGSFIPDLDHTKSKIGRKVPIFSWIINFIFGHRGMFHSLFLPFGVLILFYFFGQIVVGFGIFVGIVSHLFSDCLTKSGLRLFYPLKFRIKGFITTGSFFEIFLFGFLFALNLYLFLKLF